MIDDNFYKNNFVKFKKMLIINYSKIPKSEHEELYLSAFFKLLNSKSYKNNAIENLDKFFWQILLREALVYRKLPIKTEITENHLTNFNQNTSLLVEDFNTLLLNNLKKTLTTIEYQILFLLINNTNLTFKDIAELLGYSTSTIYGKTKHLYEKIKNEIENNRDTYYLQ